MTGFERYGPYEPVQCMGDGPARRPASTSGPLVGAPLCGRPGSHRVKPGAMVEGTREGTEPLPYEKV